MSAESGSELPDTETASKPSGPERGPSAAVGCLSSVMIAILGGALLLIVLSIALRGEARFTKGELGAIRAWLIRDGENQGLAFSTTRIVDGSERSGHVCLRTTARFAMISSGEPVEDVAYCDCYERQVDVWVPAGACNELLE